MGHERELDIFHEQIYGQTPFIDHSSMMAASWISLQATNQK